MASLVNLQTLIFRAQSRADMINANFVSSAAAGTQPGAEWTYWANSAAMDFFDKIGAADPERYMNLYSFTTTSNVADYALPADFKTLLRVDLVYGTGSPPLFYTLRKFNLLEEDAYQFPAYITLAGPAYRYRLRNGNIHFAPAIQAANTINLYYLPVIPQMVNPTDTIDGINGWEEMIILDMAMRALLKENATDITPLQMEYSRWEKKIQALAEQRDSSFPESTIDVNRGPTQWGGFTNGGIGGM